MNNVPTQKNLSEVATAVLTRVADVEEIIKSSAKSINTIAKQADSVKDAPKKLKKLQKSITLYGNIVRTVIESLCASLPGEEGKNLSDLLGRVREIDKREFTSDGRDISETKTKFTVIEAALEIPKVINSTFEIMKKMSDFKMGFKTLVMVNVNIKLLRNFIKVAMTAFFDMFSGIVNSKDIDKLLTSLVKQPDETSESIRHGYEYDKDGKQRVISDVVDKKTKGGKLGLLDIFDKAFSLIGILNTLKVPNLLLLKWRLFKMKKALKAVYESLSSFWADIEKSNPHRTMRSLGLLINGDDDKTPGLYQLFIKMKLLINESKNAIISKRKARKIVDSMRRLRIIFASIIKLMDHKNVELIGEKTYAEKLDKAKKTLGLLSGISRELILIATVSLPLAILSPAIVLFINTLSWILSSINKAFKDKDISEDVITNIDTLKDVINSLLMLSAKIILLGLIAVPAIVCMIPALIFMFVLTGFLWVVYGIMLLFPNKLIKAINEDIYKISTIFLTLAIVGAAICLLALMTPVVIKSLLEVIIFIGILLIFVIAVAGVFWLADFILSKLKGEIFGVLGIILAVTGMLLVVAIVLLLLTKIAQKIADDGGIGTITVFVLGLAGFVLAMAGLGLALGNIFVLGGLAAVAGGLAAMLGVLTLLVSIAKTINTISEINVNTTKCMASVELVLNFMTDLKEFFDEKEKEIGDEDDWEDLEDILYEVRWVTKRIYQISDILKQIQVLELKPRVVLKSVKLVFDTITQINEEVKKNKTLGDEDYWDDLEDVLDEVVGAFEEFEEITNVVNQINNLKLDKGAIKKNVGAVFDTIVQINEEVQDNAKLGDEDYWDDLEDVLDEVVEVAEHIGSITDVLNGINNLKLTEEQIKKKIISIFNLVEEINDQCAKSNALKKEDVGWFEDDSKEIAAEEMGKVAAIAKGIGTIVETLNSINEVNLDAEKITRTITDIFTFLDKTLMPTIKNSTALKPEEKDWWDRLTGKKDTKETAVDELNKISAIMESIGTITEVLSSMADFDINKAVGKSSLKQVILANIDGIFEVVDEVDKKLKTNLSAETQSEETLSFQEIINNALTESRNQRNNMRKMSKVASVLTTVGTIVDALNKVGEYKFSNTKITGNIDKIFTTIDSIYTKITEGTSAQATGGDIDLVSVVEPASEALEVLGEGMTAISEPNPDTARKNIDNYIRFIDKASKIDVQKIETSTKMFEQMSNFSNSIKGDFDKLAETLGEKLLPVLEDLKEVMGVIPEKIEASSQNISASVAASNAPATRENVEAQVNRENPNMTKEEVTKVVDTRMAEKAKSDSNGVAAKLDELISLLKGYGGENVVVQTV